jgi:hypothetical protein
MNQEIINLTIFMGLCFVGYLIFRYIPFREGMKGGSSSNVSPMSSDKSGIAGDASTYATSIKSHAIKHKDTLNVAKYRSDYENSIIHLDELVNNLMLKAALSVDHADPMGSLENLSRLNGAKSALNNVMKYIDGV